MKQKTNNENGLEENKIYRQIKIFERLVWIFIILGTFIGLYGIAIFLTGNDLHLDGLGEFFSGSVGSLWGLAGLFLIYIAFLGQKLQLIKQQEELVLNRNELQATRIELKIQNETLRRQQFENSFFQLLKFHNGIVDTIEITTTEENLIFSGRSAFKVLFTRFSENYLEYLNGNKFETVNLINVAYLDFFKENQQFIGHYFRSLYNIVKFVHLSGIPESDKKIYTNLIRSQLSTYELLLLFYNCLSEINTRFYDWVEHYSLLKAVSIKELIDVNHLTLYPKTDFEQKPN